MSAGNQELVNSESRICNQFVEDCRCEAISSVSPSNCGVRARISSFMGVVRWVRAVSRAARPGVDARQATQAVRPEGPWSVLGLSLRQLLYTIDGHRY